MKRFKGTPAPWVVDIRTGCCAVYQKKRTNDTAGCHRDDDRNIVYSSKGARYDEKLCHWVMDEETQVNFTLIATAPELLEALQKLLKYHNDFYGVEQDEDPDHPLSVAKLAIAKALGEVK